MTTPPVTPRVANVMQAAGKLAASLNHSYVGTEHLMIALIDVGAGAGKALEDAGFSTTLMRSDLMASLNGQPSERGKVVYQSEWEKSKAEEAPKASKVQAVDPWPTPPEDSDYNHFLLVGDTVDWLAAVAKIHAVTGDKTVPISVPPEVEGPFLRNLMDRRNAFTCEQFGSDNRHWQGWAISTAEYHRLARMASLAVDVREFNRLAAYPS